MELAFALTIGAVVASSVYLFLARDLPRMLLGFVLLGLAANLTLFAGGRIGTTAPPLVAQRAAALAAGAANPLPQALVLTAIVIGFGLTAFAMALVLRGWLAFGTARSEAMSAAEGPVEEPESAPPPPDAGA